jgi:hypothetical protein
MNAAAGSAGIDGMGLSMSVRDARAEKALPGITDAT